MIATGVCFEAISDIWVLLEGGRDRAPWRERPELAFVSAAARGSSASRHRGADLTEKLGRQPHDLGRCVALRAQLSVKGASEDVHRPLPELRPGALTFGVPRRPSLEISLHQTLQVGRDPVRGS
jgi:hypothetical protein